jgi:hypothetical protein
MSKPVSMAVILCAVASCFALTSCQPAAETSALSRIGTFDSRGVALAFYATEEGKKLLESGDGGPGFEMRVHQQTFSTGQVPDIIEKVKTELPRVAEEAGVSLIVSKWQIAYKDPSVEYVDVTPDFVKLFNPSGELKEVISLEMIMDMCKREPVAIETMWTVPKD